MELEEKKVEFARQGYAVASVSYDSVEALKAFSDRSHITYPMLSDPDSKIIRAFGILNETTPPGPSFGVPYPGTYFIDSRGVVVKKFFDPDYKRRYTAGSMLTRTWPQSIGGGWTEARTPQLRLRYRASDTAIRGGMTSTLTLEVALNPGMHVYAPGVTGSYIPVKWEIEPAKAWQPLECQWPASKTLHLKAIHETLPVFERRFTVTRDLTFAQQNDLVAAAGQSNQLVVTGTFRYQACDNKECFPPQSVPLKWTFTGQPHDRARVPEPFRRK